MKVCVLLNGKRGGANVPTRVVEAESTIAALLLVLRELDEKTFKKHGQISAMAYCVDGSKAAATATMEAAA